MILLSNFNPDQKNDVSQTPPPQLKQDSPVFASIQSPQTEEIAPGPTPSNSNITPLTNKPAIIFEPKQRQAFPLTLVASVIAVLIIIGLMFIYYEVMIRPLPSGPEFVVPTITHTPSLTPTAVPAPTSTLTPTPTPTPTPVPKPSFTTQVISFNFPVVLPTKIKSGYCFSNSAGDPYRQDAFRCFANNLIYDPCFASPSKDTVLCPVNPIYKNTAVLLNLTKPLPEPVLPKEIPQNWAWFISLEDGSYCYAFAGIKYATGNKVAYYECKPNIQGQETVLVGNLQPGQVWTAEKAIFIKDGSDWVVQESHQVNIKTIWQ